MNLSFANKRRLVWLINRVCEDFDVTKDELFSKSREGNVPIGRFVIWHNLFNHLNVSKINIARIFNKRDHAAIINGLKTYKNLSDTEKDFNRKVSNIEKDFLFQFPSQKRNQSLKRELTSRIFNNQYYRPWGDIGRVLIR